MLTSGAMVEICLPWAQIMVVLDVCVRIHVLSLLWTYHLRSIKSDDNETQLSSLHECECPILHKRIEQKEYMLTSNANAKIAE